MEQPKNNKKRNRTAFPYGKLKHLYVSGEESLETLSEKYSISLASLKNYCRSNLWDLDRSKYQKRVYDELNERRMEYLVLTRDTFDRKTGDMLMKTIDVLHSELVAIEEVSNKGGELDLDRLNIVLNQLQKLQQLGYRQLDVPLPKQQIETTVIKSPVKNIIEMLQAEQLAQADANNNKEVN